MSWALTVNYSTHTGTTDGSASDMQAAFDDVYAHPFSGWIIYVAAGSYTWTTSVTMNPLNTSSYTLQGAGGSGSHTSITFNNLGSIGGSGMQLYTCNGQLVQVRYIDFATSGTTQCGTGALNIDASSTADAYNSFWIESCGFNDCQNMALGVIWPNAGSRGAIYGLVDLCAFTTPNGYNGIYVFVGASSNQWFKTMSLGTTTTVCIEDNTFVGPTTNVVEGRPAIDSSYNGARWCARHNQFTNWVCVAHGSDSADTSTMQVEFYDNTITCNDVSGVDYGLYLRGGVAICYNNTIINNTGTINSGFKLQNDSCGLSYPYFQQVGQGSNFGGGTVTCSTGSGTQTTLGSYFWNNTYTNVTTQISTNGAHAAEIQLNRDYFTVAPNAGTPITSYTPLQYPHPLRGGTAATINNPFRQKFALRGSF